MRATAVTPVALMLLAAACVPADESLPLGSAQFTLSGRGDSRDFATSDRPAWVIHVERYLISFRTMTIVNLGDSDQCAYRGRGAATNTVFDGAQGSVVQAFNGLKPGDCPDVGMRLGPPDDRTVVGEGATAADLVALASPVPAHALFEATATRRSVVSGSAEDEVLRIRLRFDSERTSSSFGGCRDAIRGARIRPEARHAIAVSLTPSALFREAITTSARLRLDPFADADAQGDADGTVTIDELDAVPLSRARIYGQFYQLPNGSTRGSFGDYVRAQFQFSVRFGNGGLCNGIEAGSEEEP